MAVALLCFAALGAVVVGAFAYGEWLGWLVVISIYVGWNADCDS